MRYRFLFNVPSRIIFTLMGIGPSRSWVEVRPDKVFGQFGWSGDLTIPRVSITSVERVNQVPWWLGFGLHGFFGTWSFNGALGNAVKISVRSGARGRVLLFPIRPHTLYLSLETPDEFVHELTRET